MSAPSISASPAKRRRSSRRPPARRLVYLAYDPPAPQGEAILVPKDSALKSVADLRGKKVALNKGSNVHYLLVKALEKAGLKYTDIQPVFLAPADALAAFSRGSVDAWVIWDPYEAAAEASTGARILADGTGLVSNYQFYFSSKNFLAHDAKAVDVVLDALNEADDWTKNNIEAVAEQLSPSVGLPASVLAVSLKRKSYGILPISDDVIASQQRIADTFFGARPAAESHHGVRRSTQTGVLIMTIHTPLQPNPAPTSSGSCRPMATAAISAPPLAAATSTSIICARSRRPPTSSAISACCCRPGEAARIPGWSPRRSRRGPSGCAIWWRCGPACNRRPSRRG